MIFYPCQGNANALLLADNVNLMAADLSEFSIQSALQVLAEAYTRTALFFSRIVVIALIAITSLFVKPIVAQSLIGASAPLQDAPELTLSCGGSTASVNGVLPVPFLVGERMEYDVKFSSLKVGVGTMEIREIADVRGRPSWHTALSIKGKQLFFYVDILLESWFDVASLTSRRFHQDQRYTGHRKTQTIEIFSERGMMKEDNLPERVTVASPLDDGSFLYFVRTLPLEVGKTYSLPCYFKPDANPVKIVVVRREVVKTPAGTFNTIVLQPKIKAAGIFGEKSKAEVYLTDDAARMMVKLTSDLTVGSINLFLTKYKVGVVSRP